MITKKKTRKRSVKYYGWRPDVPDHRDKVFVPKFGFAEVPSSVDLRNESPIIVDQGPIGACVGNAVARVLEIQQIRQGRKFYNPLEGRHGKPKHDFVFAPSRLMIYYGAREIEGTTDQDAGCEIRDAIKFVVGQGACSSKTWPYHVKNAFTKPPKEAYDEALATGQALQYHRIDNNDIHALKSCLAEGTPIVLGFTVFDSFESDEVAATGDVPMPSHKESILGGHAVAAVGYKGKKFLCANSWGTDWGMGGYFWIPFGYLTDTNLASDFWAVTAVE